MRQMKDSGIEWIGEVPESWSVSKLKFFVDCYDGKRVPIDSAKRKDGIYPYWGAGSITDYVDDYIFDEELVLLGEDGAPFFDHTRPVAFLVNEKIWVNNHIHVLKVHETMSSNYIVHFLNNVDYKTYINGSILNKLTQSNMNEIVMLIPPLPEQHLISAYLDRQCTLIDSVIEKTKASIEEYKKLRQAVITQTVTAQGSKCKLSHIGTLKNGLNYHDTESDKSIKILGVGSFKEYLVLNEFEQFSDLPIDENIPFEYLLKNGDIVFVRSNGSKELVGRSVMVDNIDFPLTYSGFCIRFRNIRQDLAYNKYLLYFFRSYEFREAIKYQCFGTNINNLSQDMISSVKVSLPTIEKQQKISAYLDKKCAEIDSLITKKEQFLTELDTYKKSLIYEYVTGKKEVPQV